MEKAETTGKRRNSPINRLVTSRPSVTRGGISTWVSKLPGSWLSKYTPPLGINHFFPTKVTDSYKGERNPEKNLG